MSQVIYLNWKGAKGRETIDEIRLKDFENRKAFKAEISRLENEYSLCGMNAYRSSRPCANWKD